MKSYGILLGLIAFSFYSCESKPVKVEQEEAVAVETTTTPNEPAAASTEIPPNGEYIYDVEFAEHQGLVSKGAVTVVIQDGHIKIIDNGLLSGQKGDIINEGKIMKHENGEWIIAHQDNDVSVKEVGGCTDGPMIVKFSKKAVLFC